MGIGGKAEPKYNSTTYPKRLAYAVHEGCIESLRTAKLTKRLKSENLDAGSDLGGVSPPPRPLPRGGEVSAAKMPSPPAPAPARRLTRLPPGLPSVEVWGGSMSKDDRKEELSRSVFLLVIVKNESMRSFCCVLGVPLRSRIWSRVNKGNQVVFMTYLLEVRE